MVWLQMAKFILAKRLKEMGMSKRQLALGIGMNYPQVFRLFRKGYDPKLSLLAKCSKFLKLRVRDLIED